MTHDSDALELVSDGEITNALASPNVHDELLTPYAIIIRRRLANAGLAIVRASTIPPAEARERCAKIADTYADAILHRIDVAEKIAFEIRAADILEE